MSVSPTRTVVEIVATEKARPLPADADPYERSIRKAALYIWYKIGSGAWVYLTQWGSGTTLWRSLKTGETLAVNADGITSMLYNDGG